MTYIQYITTILEKEGKEEKKLMCINYTTVS